MIKKTQEPKQDFGFYASVPRIVRTKYKDLSHAEKWLYVCLKDLCGDKGTCFRTLRALSEETDVSTGSLSKMIPHLHKAGLIHAEKKRRSASGKEVWHISIVDIWQENAKGCSENEQSTGEVVQKMNNVVQKMNDNPEVCSKNERDCSNFVDRRKNTEERTVIEERTKEERKNGDVPAKQKASHSSTHSSSSHSQFSFSQETKPEEVVLSEEEQAVYDFGKQTIFKAKPPFKTAKLQCECAEIAKHVKTAEQFQSLVQFVRALPYIQGQVHLKNLVNGLDGWLQTQQPIEIPTTRKSGVAMSSYDDDDYVDDTFYPVREVKHATR